MAQMIFNPGDFTSQSAKPMPVILVLDNSGSMYGEKIDNLNTAVRDMLETFRQSECSDAVFNVAVVTFGTGIHLMQEMESSSSITWHDVSISDTDDCKSWTGKWDDSTARGTPLGATLRIVKSMIEDKAIIPSRAYRPAIVLVSDGHPTDSWNGPLQDFIQSGRSSKCDRWAMAIGRDADNNVLRKFIEGVKNQDGTPRQLLYAGNAKTLRDNFQFITMSVTNTVALASKSTVLTVKPISVKPTEVSGTEDTTVLMQKPKATEEQEDESGFDW